MQKTKRTLIMILMTFLLLLGMPVLASAAIQIQQPATEMFVGEKMQLAVTGTTAKVRWYTSDNTIAKVYKGKVTAKKKGTVTITAKVKKKYYSCTIQVKQPVTSMTLNQSSYFLMPEKTVQLKATCLPSTANLKTVSWSSSNKSIAKVSTKGLVTGLKNGTVTITATAKDGSGVKATCKIIVLKSTEPAKPDPQPQPPKEDPVVVPPGTSANGAKFLKILEGYDKKVMSDVASGVAWKYSQSGHSAFFSEAVNNKNRVVDCAKMVSWALRDMGILAKNEYIYGTIQDGKSIINYGKPTNSNYSKPKIDKACVVTSVSGTVQSLIEKGKIVPGDIITYKTIQHTNIYAGKTKDGKYKFYDAGRMGGDQGGYKNGVYYFNSFHTTSSSAGSSAAWVIHIK